MTALIALTASALVILGSAYRMGTLTEKPDDHGYRPDLSKESRDNRLAVRASGRAAQVESVETVKALALIG